MLEISTLDRRFWSEAVCKPDAFVWWYIDLRSAAGTGLVLLWGVGIPFVKTPSRRPAALQLVFYEGGRPEYYHLGTFDEFSELSPEGSARFPGGTIDVSDANGEIRIAADINLLTPYADGFSLTLEMSGERFEGARSSSSLHRWAPRTVSSNGKARLGFGMRDIELAGPSYFDTNAAHVPLSEQGFRAWRWGRVALPNESWIFYEVLGGAEKAVESLVFRVEPGSRVVDCDELAWGPGVRAFYGLVSPRRGTIRSAGRSLEIESEALVDDGPFYQRHLLRGTNERGEVGYGFYEVVDSEKLARRWHTPFVNMRILRHDVRDNSFWLPLFRGQRAGRFARLARSAFSSGGGNRT